MCCYLGKGKLKIWIVLGCDIIGWLFGGVVIIIFWSWCLVRIFGCFCRLMLDCLVMSYIDNRFYWVDCWLLLLLKCCWWLCRRFVYWVGGMYWCNFVIVDDWSDRNILIGGYSWCVFGLGCFCNRVRVLWCCVIGRVVLLWNWYWCLWRCSFFGCWSFRLGWYCLIVRSLWLLFCCYWLDVWLYSWVFGLWLCWWRVCWFYWGCCWLYCWYSWRCCGRIFLLIIGCFWWNIIWLIVWNWLLYRVLGWGCCCCLSVWCCWVRVIW